MAAAVSFGTLPFSCCLLRAVDVFAASRLWFIVGFGPVLLPLLWVAVGFYFLHAAVGAVLLAGFCSLLWDLGLMLLLWVFSWRGCYLMCLSGWLLPIVWLFSCCCSFWLLVLLLQFGCLLRSLTALGFFSLWVLVWLWVDFQVGMRDRCCLGLFFGSLLYRFFFAVLLGLFCICPLGSCVAAGSAGAVFVLCRLWSGPAFGLGPSPLLFCFGLSFQFGCFVFFHFFFNCLVC